jgi:surface carbohydrate biosynthesis protein
MAVITPTLYLPIEDAARELDSKILIAGAAVARGLSVVIGQQWLLVNNHAAVPLGLMMFKGMNARQANAMRVASRTGHLTAASDEEAMGLADIPYIQRDIDADIAGYCQLFFAQGPLHARAIAGKTGAGADAIRTVGNARIDLLRRPFTGLFEREAEALRRRHGDFILLNTNIGGVNSAFGGIERYREVVIRIGWMDPDKPEDVALFETIVAFDHANLALSRDVAEKLAAAFPGHKVIIRPHGSERLDTWLDFAGDKANIEVIREGRHASWILASRAVVHTCCTTGLESEILRRTAVNLRPEHHERSLHRVYIANVANISASDSGAVTGLLAPVLDGDTSGFDAGRVGRMTDLADHIAGLDGAFAYQRIADAAADLLAQKGGRPGDFRWQPTDPASYLGAVRRTDYQREKISLSQNAFECAWKELNDLAGQTGGVDIRQIGDSLFLVEPRGN